MMRQYMTADYMFRLGQYYLLDEDISSAERFLRLASAKGHEEAIWLVSLMHKTPHIQSPDIANDNDNIRPWCRSLFNNDNSDRALCYRLWFTDDPDLKLSKYAADTGNPIGQYKHYIVMYQVDEYDENPSLYIGKAAAQDFLMAIKELANRSWSKANDPKNNRRTELYLRGAEFGEPYCINRTSTFYNKINNPSREDKINAAKWTFRDYIWGDRSVNFADDLNLIGSSNYPMTYIYYYFTVGREADGYDEFFPMFSEKEHNALQKATEFYRMILNKAGESALYTFWMLKPILSKDIAKVIAKMVYDSRLDPMVWIVFD